MQPKKSYQIDVTASRNKERKHSRKLYVHPCLSTWKKKYSPNQIICL